MEIQSLLQEAFFDADAAQATRAIAEARERVSREAKVDAFSLEVVVPEQPDDAWLRDRVLRPLVYFCQSTGVPPPACAGVFLSFFHDARLSCVLGAEVIAWAAQALGLDTGALLDRFGTGESEHAAPRAPGP